MTEVVNPLDEFAESLAGSPVVSLTRCRVCTLPDALRQVVDENGRRPITTRRPHTVVADFIKSTTGCSITETSVRRHYRNHLEN